MSQNQGIFKTISGSKPETSPHAARPAQPMHGPSHPMAQSPFTLLPDGDDLEPADPGTPGKLPEGHPRDEVPFPLTPQTPAGARPALAADIPPFETMQPPPFTVSEGSAAAYPAGAGFADAPVPAAYPPWQQPPYAAPPPVASPFAASPAKSLGQGFIEDQADSSCIKQLELRAIFGVDREMSHEEIMNRARALPGIRHLALLDAAHIGALDGLRQVLSSLGFASSGLRISCGCSPVEFIREGAVILAVQTDGGFAPGTREALMLVARELGR